MTVDDEDEPSEEEVYEEVAESDEARLMVLFILTHMNLKMVVYMLANGSKDKRMVVVSKCGLMDPFMKDIEKIIWLMVTAD